ncbi:hypothetical protein Tco_0112578, partial [Tanacetum coccineum]
QHIPDVIGDLSPQSSRKVRESIGHSSNNHGLAFRTISVSIGIRAFDYREVGCTVSKFLGKFIGYTPSKEEEEEPEKKGLKEAPEKGSNYELLSYTISDSDSDLEFTARSGPKCNKLEDTCESGVRPNT